MDYIKGIHPNDVHNQKLVNNVHPGNWSNPTPEPMYNMVVVGAGTAGLISAIATASLGGKVALIERHLLGGDCLNVGCVPSKSLIRPARLAAEMRNADKFGLSSTPVSRDDFPKVMERLRRIRADISKNDSVERYSELGVDVFLGNGVFKSATSIEVEGKILNFRKAVVATGARAWHPTIPGLEEIGFLTNESVFNLTSLPEHLLVIGGGPIGCELAQAFRRLGAKVTIVQNDRFLPNEDEDASRILADVFRREGIQVLLHANTLKAEQTESGRKKVVVEVSGKTVEIEADEILIGAGRVPNVEGIGLDVAGVEYDSRKGVIVNDYLRTTNKNIYAAGDCCMAWKFTHAADAAAQIVVQNALFKGRKKLSSLTMPWCTYTDPEIAHVGMYEKDARAKGMDTEFFKFEMAENDRALADGEETGFVKVMVKKGSDRILGATIVSAHAGEMISEITTAMSSGIGLGKLAGIIHPYPTQADAIRRVAGLYNKNRLTPKVAKVLKWWLKFQR
jgi:pyruvate/2-oxoglutarate dehydrogenase complex dihydrolipoamide dehydrogenase (E3) component